MKRLNVWSGLLLLLLAVQCALPVQAREVDGLYQAEVPVKGQSREERLAVYGDLLSQVVIKLTGDRSAPQSPRLAKAMAAPQNLVQQYLYQELDSPSLREQGYSHRLVVIFDERALDQLLVAAALPLWGRTRPDLLVWLAVEDGVSRTLAAAGDGGEPAAALLANANRRALPLLLPSLDGEELKRIGFADVWGNLRQTVMDASRRYGANAVLVGRVNRQGGIWQGRWSLYQGEDAQHWAGSSADLDGAVASGIDGVADRFARRYAQVMTAGTANRTEVLVTGVNSVSDYARAQQYLLSLDLITRVQVTRVDGDEVLFTLDVRGDAGGIGRAIALGGTLRPAPLADNNQSLRYQLQP